MSLENQNRDYSSIKDIFRKRASPKKSSSKTKKAPPFSLRLTEEERDRLNSQTGNQPLGAYIRSRIFGKDVEVRRPVRRTRLDHQKLALLLAELGNSRLASNMNQLARSLVMGCRKECSEKKGKYSPIFW